MNLTTLANPKTLDLLDRWKNLTNEVTAALGEEAPLADVFAFATAVHGARKMPAPKPAVAAGRANERATQGRRDIASGKRPPLVQALLSVIGKETLHLSDIIARLNIHGWAPNSKNPREYVAGVLSRESSHFVRSGRGRYRAKRQGALS